MREEPAGDPSYIASMSDTDEIDASKRRNKSSYTPRHPIPTVKDYWEEKGDRRAKAQNKVAQHGDIQSDQKGHQIPAQHEGGVQVGAEEQNESRQDQIGAGGLSQEDQANAQDVTEDTSEAIAGAQDPKMSRKTMQKRKDDRAEREVTDPVTHLPVIVHDMTADDFKNVPKNEPRVGSDHKTMTGVDAVSKSTSSLQDESREVQQSHAALEQLFPPPNFRVARAELIRLYHVAFTVGLGLIVVALAILFVLERLLGVSETIQSSIIRRHSSGNIASTMVLLGAGLGLGSLIVIGTRQWVESKIKAIWETELWEAERQEGKRMQGTKACQSPEWLNALLTSVWPLINPDLFTSLADTLEVRH